MGRRKRDGNHSPPKNNLIQDSEGNEENGYPVPDSNKTKINDGKEPSNAHKSILKEIQQVVTVDFMKLLLDIFNQNAQEALKKFQDTKNKEYEKTQKQINELIGALNKYQSETENTRNREITELKTKIDNIKEEVTHDMENLRKKNEAEIQNTVEGHYSNYNKQKTESQNLKMKWKLKEKLKSYYSNNSKPVKGICKNSLTPSKDQT
jgi:DNA anti-recombination protein RmuC